MSDTTMDQVLSLPVVLANTSVPWLWQFHKIAFLVAVPGMLLEMLFVRRISDVTFNQAFTASLSANLLSALFGFPMAWAMRSFYDSLMGYELVGFLLPFALFYLLSVFIEAHVFSRMELQNHFRASAVANLFSHLLIVATVLLTGYAMF